MCSSALGCDVARRGGAELHLSEWDGNVFTLPVYPHDSLRHKVRYQVRSDVFRFCSDVMRSKTNAINQQSLKFACVALELQSSASELSSTV